MSADQNKADTYSFFFAFASIDLHNEPSWYMIRYDQFSVAMLVIQGQLK